MKTKKLLFYLLLCILISCEYEEIVPPEPIPVDPSPGYPIPIYPIIAPYFISFSLIPPSESTTDKERIECIVGENQITGISSPILTNTYFIPEFEIEGAYVEFDGKIIESNQEKIDFSLPQEFTVYDESGGKTVYKVTLKIDSGFPAIYITTEQPITTKEEYVKGSVKIDNLTKEEYNGEMEIRLRGNGTMGYRKKPYHIKLNKKRLYLICPHRKTGCYLPIIPINLYYVILLHLNSAG